MTNCQALLSFHLQSIFIDDIEKRCLVESMHLCALMTKKGRIKRTKSFLRGYLRFTDDGVLNLKLQVSNNRAGVHSGG